MLKQQLGVTWTVLSSPAMLPAFLNSKSTCICSANSTVKFTNIDKSLQLIRNYRRVMLMRNFRCRVRRRVRYEDDEEDEEEYGHNEEIVALESYSLSARGEALLVRAVLDDRDFEVLVFKGFSSSLSHGTSPDPSKSVLPARAVIKAIDRIKGPFDPSNIEYIEKDLQWEAFKSRLDPA
ncbi:hypothetical protein CICLE_v10016899mg [Citrus x clementina]|uniref:DUF7734 domain-containing protein n=1 Tax=Citrus clementina TaxID=85681 RepID=V4UB60_CITCL|nr:uncharacterized protein LOC18052905 [Citrus x clementina]ESR61390.1 hypothetical protein CICLE_v10016899mg [Citrus x clementina]